MASLFRSEEGSISSWNPESKLARSSAFPFHVEADQIEVDVRLSSRKRERKSSLGPLVAALLEKKPLTRARVAHVAGMSPAQMSNFLNGKADIMASTFVEILAALGFDLLKILRAEAASEKQDLESLPRSLKGLPRAERETLLQFLSAYQARARQEMGRRSSAESADA